MPLHRRRRTLRQTQTRPARRDRRIRLERALYTDELIPFEEPVNKGKIPIKVINHYGNKVLKVYEVVVECKQINLTHH